MANAGAGAGAGAGDGVAAALAAANQAIVDIQAEQQVLRDRLAVANRRTPNQKIERFTNEPGTDWTIFRLHASNVAVLNGYDDLQARLALASAMSGKAALAVMDIDPRSMNAAGLAEISFAELLQKYEDRFVPTSASQIARVRFDHARQGSHEDVLDYHGRLRALYNKAYPAAADDVALIRRFIHGLRRKELRMQVMRLNPVDYPSALQAAQNEASVLQMVKVSEMGAGAMDEPMDISAMEPANKPGTTGKNGSCHFCGKAGHWKRECNLLKKAQQFGAGRGRGGGARGGRGRGRPGPGQQRANLVAALEAALHEDEKEEGNEEAAGEQEAPAEGDQDF